MKYIKVLLISLAVILATALVIAYLFYSKANTELYTLDATARKDVAGSFITLKDGVTHYELSGADTGKVVVLVHGFSVPYYIWDSTFSRLVQEGFRVLRYDEFGRGFSDRPDVVYEAPLFRRQLSDLLDGLHIKSVHAIAGLSFGGPVVADFVGHNPGLVSKVILVDPVYPEAGPQDMPFSESFQRYKMALSPETMVSGQLTDLKYPARFPSWADQYKVQMQYKGLRRALVSTRLHYATPDMIRASYRTLDSLHKPVLLIWGKEDRTVPSRYADSLRKVLRTDYMPVEDAGHLPQMEKAGQVNERIIAFLAAH